jgi:hypothetical protein
MNSTTQHTPGPWKAEGRNNLVVNSRDGNTIIIEPGGSEYAKLEELQANARLIAAAPDLLAALREAATVLKWAAQESKGKVKAEIVGGWIYHAEKAQDAIAKTTGEEVQS